MTKLDQVIKKASSHNSTLRKMEKSRENEAHSPFLCFFLNNISLFHLCFLSTDNFLSSSFFFFPLVRIQFFQDFDLYQIEGEHKIQSKGSSARYRNELAVKS